MTSAATISAEKPACFLPAFLLFFLLFPLPAATAGNAPADVALAEVKIEKAPFREAFSTIQALLREKHLKAAIDPVHDIPANFDNPKAFTFAQKDAALGDLLTSFCRYYGLDWKQSGDTIVFSLPRPRP